MTPEDYDNAITAVQRHSATGLFFLIISSDFDIICFLIIHIYVFKIPFNVCI